MISLDILSKEEKLLTLVSRICAPEAAVEKQMYTCYFLREYFH